MEDEIRHLLLTGAKELGTAIDDQMLEKFIQFTELLLERNKVMNLTAITEPREIAVKHYLDSLSLLKYVSIDKGASLIDVGCGAGFPAVPLKIVRPDINLCCLDSVNKRLNFLTDALTALGFNDCVCIHARAEDAGRKPELREAFDVATARAVAKMQTLAEYCLPLVKKGGVFAAMKGPDGEQEAEAAQTLIADLGGEIEKIYRFTLAKSDFQRTIIIIRKKRHSLAKYPRPAGTIKNS